VDHVAVTPYYEDERATLYHARWQDVELPRVDAVITDPPYSARTHDGQRHGRGLSSGASDATWVNRKGIEYPRFGPLEVNEASRLWSALCSAWMAVMTDSELYHLWRDGLRDEGRTVFQPLPCVMSGMNVRLAGDGPSSWCVWLVVSRPKMPPWGTLPGAYASPPSRDAMMAGQKPLTLMFAIVRDYSRHGDLVLDPCMGSGTTGVAAIQLGRRFIGVEMDERTLEIAAKRIMQAREQMTFTPGDFAAKQEPLL
jgi:site-specific DNA-methyltransferase (adenine-specific)